MSRWRLENFLERLDLWVEQENPPDGARRRATAWILTRFDDPYQGVRREPDFDNLWFGVIPGAVHDGRVAVCSYWVVEQDHLVRCDSFATLTLPI